MRNRIGRPRFNQGPASARGIESFSTATGTPFTPAGNIEATNVQDAIEELDAEKVAKAGDTMSGFLTLNAAPTSDLHAATKLYVDASVGSVTHPESVLAVATISDAPPVSPIAGQLWWQSSTGYMFIYFNDGTSSQWVPVMTQPVIPLLTMAAPTLDLETDETDLTPDFTLSGDLAEDDLVRFQYSTASDFTGATELTNTIDAAEDAANAISFSTGSLAADTWFFRARVERVGYLDSDWSNVETIELTGPSTGPEVSQFLARATTLTDPTRIAAYTALIEGLVTDGIWSKIDALYVFAAHDATTARLNLKSSSYTGTAITGSGPLVFIPDDGYDVNGTTNTYVDTNLNASTAGGNYTQDSAHMMCWCNPGHDDPTGGVVGTVSGSTQQYILPHYSFSLIAYFRLNTNSGGINVAVADGYGFTLANRSSSTAIQGYRNGASIVTGSEASQPLNNSNFSFPDQAALADSSGVYCGGSFGGSLTAGEVADYYTHLRAFMTAVGVP